MVGVLERENPEVSFEFNNMPTVKRRDIWLADMSLALGSEQAGTRYVLVISNDTGNKFSGTVEVCCITSQIKTKLPTHVYLPLGSTALPKESTIMTEQKRTIDKMRLIKHVGELDRSIMFKVDEALKISLDLY